MFKSKFMIFSSFVPIILCLSSCQMLNSITKKTYFSRTYSIYKEKITSNSITTQYSIADRPVKDSTNAFKFTRDLNYNIGDFPLDSYIKIGKTIDISNDNERINNKSKTYFNFHINDDNNPFSGKIEIHIAYNNDTFDDYLIPYYVDNDKIHMTMSDGSERIGINGYFIIANNRISLIPIDIKIDGVYQIIMIWIKNGIFGKPIDNTKED